ncbi:MAG TPA: DsbA family protein [Kofleriaceae bacterium]|nr:DsbA family protein [Kofleriaceae bacterium]
MTLFSRLRGAAIGTFLDGDRVRHTLAAARRRVRGGRPTVHFHHDPGDPWSHLALQVAVRIADTYPVDVAFHLVGPPAADVDPAPALRAAYAVRDAAELALHWDVEPAGHREADPAHVRRACSVLIRPRPDREQLAIALELGRALWSNDAKALTAAIGKHGSEATGSIPPHLAAAYSAMRDAGFYQAASFGYEGDWYAGIERVGYLEDRLIAELGVTPPRRALVPRPASARPPAKIAGAGARPSIEVWWSFRSPYSYLAVTGLERLARTMAVDLVWKPVLPMLTRGLAVPRAKRLYLVHDAHREAERQGIPFGQICDPLGKGVEHAMAIAKLAIAQGRALPYLASIGRGVWAEAKDLTDYVDLRGLVERAGLDWADAREALADESWRVWAADHAAELNAAGLWGVPSFRVGDHVAWGQDRLDLLADRLRRHLAAVATEAPAAAPPPPA